jgi:hypothetical protein
MATKKCPNGHQYDPSIYGDNCPFCPESSHTRVNPADDFGGETRATSGAGEYGSTAATRPVNDNFDMGGGHTVIRTADGTTNHDPDGGRKLVGLLVTYDTKPSGDVFKVFEGRTTIGRKSTCDICIASDDNMSSEHLLIQYVPAKGAFRAQEFGNGSSNGTYVNGVVYVLGDTIDLKNNDVIVLGKTKFVFLAIPEF